MLRLKILFVLLALTGCSQRTVLQFAEHRDVAELPERHRANISDGLLLLYGTPVNPRSRQPDPEAEEPEEDQLPQFVDLVAPEHLQYGSRVYNARCAGCHGVTGDGNGPAGQYLRPRPRDYRRGIFKFTSTPYGAKPARHDLVRTIRRGAKGTSMPGFPWMSDQDLNAVIDYVMFLSRRGEVERDVTLMAQEYDEEEDIDFIEFTDAIDSSVESWHDAETAVVLPVTAEPAYGQETVTAGRTLFLSQGCSKCHGEDGKGQVEWLSPEFLAEQDALPADKRVQINYDAWNEPAPAADLTARMLHGGRRPIDIYRRIYTGINGTPMPAFNGLFAEEPEKIWQLVHYVRHVIEGGDPAAGIVSLPPEANETTATTGGAESASENTDVVADDRYNESDEVDETVVPVAFPEE